MIKPQRYKYILALSDLVILAASVFFTFIFVENNNRVFLIKAGASNDILLYPFLLVSLGYFFIFQTSQLYKPSVILRRSAHISAVMKAVLYISTALVVFSLLLSYSSFQQAGLLIATFAVISFILLYVYRVEIITPFYVTKGEFSKHILIVGNGEAGTSIASAISSAHNRNANVVGFLDAEIKKTPDATNGKYLGTIAELNTIIRNHYVNEIIITHNNHDYNELLKIIDHCRKENISLKVHSPLLKVVYEKVKCEKIGNIPLVNLSKSRSLYVELGLKRAIDILGALAGLLLLLPLFIVLGIIIKATSTGPVFFKQIRIGKNGKHFRFYKFRSMYQVKNEDEERAKKMKVFINKQKLDSEDAKVVDLTKVTKIGAFIRKYSLDELPQFYNVLKGEMSLVGPRPIIPYEFECYADWQKRRINGFPGCTGVWQVKGRSAVTFNDTIILDLYYLYNISFLLDLEMIVKTLPVMLLARGGK